MIDRIRFIWQLMVVTFFLLVLGILLIPRLNVELCLNYYLVSLISVSAINLIAYMVMTTGIRKSNREGTVILMAGIGLKFLLYILYIMVFWLVTKNLSKPFIIAFFALYLVFTFLLGLHLFKALKNK